MWRKARHDYKNQGKHNQNWNEFEKPRTAIEGNICSGRQLKKPTLGHSGGWRALPWFKVAGPSITVAIKRN